MMDLKRAKQINDACIAHKMALMGLRLSPPPPIDQYTLGEMLAAGKVIRRHEKLEAAALPKGKGRTLRIVCDDRLLAALYVACHYVAENPRDCEPVVVVDATAVVVVSYKKPTIAVSHKLPEEEEEVRDPTAAPTWLMSKPN